MRKLLPIILFFSLFISTQILYSQPLQYNLQPGDEWVVKVSSKSGLGYVSPIPGLWYLESSNLDIYIKMKTLRSSESINESQDTILTKVRNGFETQYEPIEREYPMLLKGTILRIIRKKDGHIYDTDYGYSPLDKTDSKCMSLINKEYVFTINEYGETKWLDQLHIRNSKILNEEHDTYEKFFRAGLDSYRPEVFDHQFMASVFQCAFPITLSREMFIKKYPEYTNSIKVLAILEQKEASDHVKYIPLSSQHYSSRGKQYVFRDSYGTENLLVFSKEKGRITKGKIENERGHLDNPFGFGQLYSLEYIENYTPKTVQDAVITGKIQNFKGEPVTLYMWKKFPDAKMFKLDSTKTKINADGTFKFVMPIKREFEVTFRVGELGVENTLQEILFIEPGDSVDIHVKKDRIYYAGKDAYKYEQFQVVDNMLKNLSQNKFKNPKQLIKSIDDCVNKAKLILLEDSISIWAKRNYMAKAYFGAYRVGLEYISRNVLYHEKKNKWINEVYDSVDPNQYASYSSFDMRQFIGSYVKNRMDYVGNINGYIGKKLNWTAEVAGSFLNSFLDVEGSYYALAEMMWQNIGAAKIDKSLEIFELFKNQFPDAEITEYYDKLLGNLSLLMAGNVAPDFTVQDEDGDLINLSDYRGKWVCFMFVSSDTDPQLSRIKSLEYYTKYMDDSRFKPLLILTDKKVSFEKIQEIRKYYHGQIAFNPQWKYPSTQVYNVSYRTGAFLINPKGKMEFPWFNLPRKLTGNYESYIVKETNKLKQYMDSKAESVVTVSSKTLYMVIGITMALLILLFVVFIVWRQRVKRNAEEKKAKLQLELKAIRSQLNPHFMFNSLSSIQNLVAEDKKLEASTYLSQFAGLMRQVLNNSEKELIPLEEELSAVKKYLKLEALRFNFKYNLFVDEKLDVFNIEVPGLFLQPFVENAVIHGVAGLENSGSIKLSIVKESDHMVCRVEDNGNGYYPHEKEANNGCGISLTEKRFQIFRQTIKSDIRFKITNKHDVNKHEKGTLVEIFYELDRD